MKLEPDVGFHNTLLNRGWYRSGGYSDLYKRRDERFHTISVASDQRWIHTDTNRDRGLQGDTLGMGVGYMSLQQYLGRSIQEVLAEMARESDQPELVKWYAEQIGVTLEDEVRA